jgi:DNA-binding NarL/FixJ family response regulator
MKRLLIVADHSLVAHSIRLAFRETTGFEVIGFVDGRASVSRSLIEHAPDVVVVDEMRSCDDPLARIREAAECLPKAKVLLLTMRMDDEWISEAFAAGAHTVLAKSMHRVTLGTLLREVVRGSVVHRYESPPPPVAEACELSDRQLEVLRLAAGGLTNGQIGQALWLTEQTVKFHLSNTYRKLGVANRTEATSYAHIHALVGPPERLAC